MIVTTTIFLITVICEESESEHLVSNVKMLEPVHYSIEDVNNGIGAGAEKSGKKVQFLFKRNLYQKAMSYIIDNYVKRYGVIIYSTEVSVPF